MFKIIGFILVIILIPASLVLFYYLEFKDIESKSKSIMRPFYVSIGVRLFILLLWISLLWMDQFHITNWWVIFGLIYFTFDIIITILLSRKVQSWRKEQKN